MRTLELWAICSQKLTIPCKVSELFLTELSDSLRKEKTEHTAVAIRPAMLKIAWDDRAWSDKGEDVMLQLTLVAKQTKIELLTYVLRANQKFVYSFNKAV